MSEHKATSRKVPVPHDVDNRVAKTRERLEAAGTVYIGCGDEIAWSEMVHVEDDGSAWLFMGIDSVNAILDEVRAKNYRRATPKAASNA